jgi:hypothetical protein
MNNTAKLDETNVYEKWNWNMDINDIIETLRPILTAEQIIWLNDTYRDVWDNYLIPNGKDAIIQHEGKAPFSNLDGLMLFLFLNDLISHGGRIIDFLLTFINFCKYYTNFAEFPSEQFVFYSSGQDYYYVKKDLNLDEIDDLAVFLNDNYVIATHFTEFCRDMDQLKPIRVNRYAEDKENYGGLDRILDKVNFDDIFDEKNDDGELDLKQLLSDEQLVWYEFVIKRVLIPFHNDLEHEKDINFLLKITNKMGGRYIDWLYTLILFMNLRYPKEPFPFDDYIMFSNEIGRFYCLPKLYSPSPEEVDDELLDQYLLSMSFDDFKSFYTDEFLKSIEKNEKEDQSSNEPDQKEERHVGFLEKLLNKFL